MLASAMQAIHRSDMLQRADSAVMFIGKQQDALNMRVHMFCGADAATEIAPIAVHSSSTPQPSS